VVATTNRDNQSSKVRWLFPLLGSLLLCILAFWTRYAAAVMAPSIALYLGFSFKNNGWKWAVGFLLLFLLGASPWLIRNKTVSGGFFGLAPYTALNNTHQFEDNRFERSLAPSLSAGRVVPELQSKMVTSLQKYYEGNLRTVGDGIFICLFLTAFFYRFVREPVHLLRWGVALGAILLIGIASIFGDSTISLLNMFWPMVLLYGLAFFFILLDRLQLRVRLFNLAITTLLIILSALPLILTMMPPRAGVPYPPYFPPFVMHVSKMLSPDELMCTDMPWATAWYGNRNSLLLPGTIDEFYEINDYSKRISGLYFTTITRNKPYVSGLLTGSDRTWFPLLEGRIPSDFPLTQGFPLNNMDQIFLTDRIRWKQ